MKTSTLHLPLLLITILFSPFRSQAQSWEGMSVYSSSNDDHLYKGVKDKDDNTYWLGTFHGEMKIGSTTLRNDDGEICSALFKRGSDGNIKWVVQMGIGTLDNRAVASVNLYLNESKSEILVLGSVARDGKITFTNAKGADKEIVSNSTDSRFEAYYSTDGELKSVTLYNSSIIKIPWAYVNASSDIVQTTTVGGEPGLSCGPLNGTQKWETAFKGAIEIGDVYVSEDDRIAVIGYFDNTIEIGDSIFTHGSKRGVFFTILDKNGKPLISDFLKTAAAGNVQIGLNGNNVYVAAFFDEFVSRRNKSLMDGDVTPIIHFKISNDGKKLLHRSTILARSNEMNFKDITPYGKHVLMAGRANDFIQSTDDEIEQCYGTQDCALAAFDTTSKKVKFLIGGGTSGASEYFYSALPLSTGKILLGGVVGSDGDDIVFGGLSETGKGGEDMVIASTSITPTNIRENESRASKITVYPNPATRQLVITSPTEVEQIKVIDMNGQVVHDAIPLNTSIIDISNLVPGHYIIKAYSASQVWHSQFVKN